MMHKARSRIRTGAVAAVLVLLAAGAAVAQTYPSRPVRIVVPNAPGGPSDLTARVLSQKLSDAWGQAVLVDNRAGAGGNIGLDAVAKSAPDGYTLLLTGSGSIAINPSMYANIPFDPIKDFAPVSLVVSTPLVLAVSPHIPANSVAELVRLAKSQPGRLNYASTGIGNNSHLIAEMLSLQAGIKLVHVTYRSIPQAYAGLMTGEVAILFDTTNILGQVRAGKLKALAVTGKTRSALAPELPTMMESGLPDFEATAWFGVFAPAGTTPGIVTLVNAELERALEKADVRQKLTGVGFEVVGGSPERLDAQLKADLVRWATLIKAAGIKAQ